jgi:hypothetical protein
MKLAGVSAVAFKVAADQALLLPTFTPVFFIFQAVCEGCTIYESIHRAQTTFWLIVTNGWKFWIIIHIATFGLIPTRHRIAWSSIASVAWGSYISHENHLKKQTLYASTLPHSQDSLIKRLDA